MAWDDPSPLRRARPATPRSLPSAGGHAPTLPFSRLLLLMVAAVLLGALGYALALGGIHALRGPHVGRGPGLDTALALAGAAVVAVLSFRFLLSRPPSTGGWFGRRRAWDDGYGNGYSPGDQVVGEVVADLVEAVIDGAID